MGQVAQMIGAVLILGAFVAAQQRRLSSDSIPFLAMNTLGGAILAVVAATNRDLGFLLLEGVWAIVSARGLIRARRKNDPAMRG